MDDQIDELGDGKPVFAAERKGRILDLVETHGRVRVRELAEIIGVTEPTIRKDITDLHNQRRLRRTHGGAIALRPAYEPDVSTREAVHVEAKLSIAKACLAEIQDGDAVFLDSGTTVNAIADLLAGGTSSTGPEVPRPRNVNVLTNSLEVARRLASVADVRHTVLGGQYRPVGACFVGPLTVSTLQQFTLNVAFIGVTGLSDGGFTVADINEAQLKTAAMDRARRVIVPMDHSKLGASDFVQVCELDRVDVLVTDSTSPHLDLMTSQANVRLVVTESQS